MAKKKALEVCKNLYNTIENIKNKPPAKIYKLDDWKPPTADANDLIKILNRIEKKYNLSLKDYFNPSE